MKGKPALEYTHLNTHIGTEPLFHYSITQTSNLQKQGESWIRDYYLQCSSETELRKRCILCFIVPLYLDSTD